MMVSNMTDDRIDQPAMSLGKLALRMFGATVAAVFFSGAAAGLIGALGKEEQVKPIGWVIMSVFAALTLAALWFAWVSARRYYRENGPLSPRARRATISAVVAGGLGLVMGAWMSICRRRAGTAVRRGQWPPSRRRCRRIYRGHRARHRTRHVVLASQYRRARRAILPYRGLGRALLL